MLPTILMGCIAVSVEQLLEKAIANGYEVDN